MKSIREFFARIQNRQFQEIQLRASISDAVTKHTRVVLPPDSISFSPKVLVLKGLNQSAKSAIFIKKTYILKDLNEILPARMIADIRLI